MFLTKEEKSKVFKKYGGSEKNTGSPEGQIAMLTHRISHISGHIKDNKKDFSTLRTLGKLVSQRKKLLKYLTNKDINRYRNIIKELKLRK